MATIELSIMAFPQSWDGTRLSLNLLVIPTSDPTVPPPSFPAGSPPFKSAHLVFAAGLIPSLANLPDAQDPALKSFPLSAAPPAGASALFDLLKTKFNLTGIATSPGRRDNTFIKKHLPPSYTSAFPFEQARTPFAFTGKEFECAIRDEGQAAPPKKPPPSDKTTWGQVLSLALRQPLLSTALGLSYQGLQITPAAADVAGGGWLLVSLASTSDYAGLAGVQLYAARLPALLPTTRRPLFGAVLFPVMHPPSGSDYSSVFPQAEDYDDGFAKIVHCAQPGVGDAASLQKSGLPPAADAGLLLGWDDEQVAIWMNRQITTDPATAAQQAPLGVLGYRVDVQLPGEGTTWHPLQVVQGELKIDMTSLGRADGKEQCVETAPVRFRDASTDYWLPAYFAQWRGKSLVIGDDLAYKSSGAGDPAPRQLQPVLTGVPPLRYGQTYQFRVRLCDLTGGGPAATDPAINAADAPVGKCDFRRFVPPKAPILQDSDNPVPESGVLQTAYVFRRPLLGYPDYLFAGNTTDPTTIDPKGKDVGVPDPDVKYLQVTVEARAAANDTSNLDGPFFVLYRALRQFPADPTLPLELDLAFQDVINISALPAPGSSGPLPVPTARDVRVRVAAVGKEDPTLIYFGNDAVRTGPTFDLSLRQGIGGSPPKFVYVARKDSADETGLYRGAGPAERVQAIYLQPDPPPASGNPLPLPIVVPVVGPPPAGSNLAQRLGAQVQLAVSGLTLSGRSGSRVVFGAAGTLRHSLSADHGSLTFATQSELLGHWLVVLRLTLNRDWTWDGMQDQSFLVKRGGQVVGSIDVRQIIPATALLGSPQRDRTELVFIDAVRGDPDAGSFPRELLPSYEVVPQLRGTPTVDPTFKQDLRLPVTTPPAQVPQLVSAGLALSDYQRAADYSSSAPRTRMLWLELAEPIADSGQDEYFARVLVYGPDPLLTSSHRGVPTPRDPPLPVPPEPIRVIGPGQSADKAGLDAMQPLIKSSSDRHYLVPLPPGLDAESLLLFGFFTYELRVGHVGQWSTGQARFGRQLRVAGVQHPPPHLSCLVRHDPGLIRVRAPYATPVTQEGVRLNQFEGPDPQTDIWVLLYAQVTQADGADHRNVLLVQRQAHLVGVDGGKRLQAIDMRDFYAESDFSQREIGDLLAQRCLPLTAPLSVLAVELFREAAPVADPLAGDLGKIRMLRASTLVPVPPVCT